MRRSRRGGHSGHEFGGSGEDSFVAVVVTKLTGALLFILLLTMVIMALLPKAIDLPASPTRAQASPDADDAAEPLLIRTPATMPEAITGHAYQVALAATGGRGPLAWSVDGVLPEGLTLDGASGLVQGTPKRGTREPVPLVLRVADGTATARQPTALTVLQPDQPWVTPGRWRPSLPPVPWRAWLDQGFGFLLLALVHLVGLNVLRALEQRATLAAEAEAAKPARFGLYRACLWLGTIGCAAGLGVFLMRGIG